MKCHSLIMFHYFFYISIFYSYFLISIALATNSENCYTGKIRTAGTGTVLFNPTDVYKTCWSQEEIAILTARLILEDVIPDPKVVSIQCNEDVEDLVEYFKAVIDTIRSNTKARKRHIMLMAFADLLGGYLHHAIFPKARRAYYAGAVDYSYMEKLIQLYEELKWFLRTNGQGWTKPMLSTKEVRVPPIELDKYDNKKPNDSCCNKLLFFEHEPVKTRKRAVSTEKGIYFPLPFFDAKYRPTAIVVPLKKFALRNIESKRAAFVLMKYFISAEKCLKEKNAKPDMIQRFHNNLFTWIEKEVVPKLNDNKFYSAFGGILRVQNTLKFLGAKAGPATCNSDEGEEEVGAVPAVGCTTRRNKIILIAMLIVIVAWFLIGTCFICYRMKNGRGNKTNKFDETRNTKPGSTSSFSSSKWSSFLSRSSSRSSKSHKQLCKCCESSISEKSTAGYTSTSEYDSEKTRKKRKKMFGPSNRKVSQSTPCVCPSDAPAIIDPKQSMKVLPSIAEMSENSLSKGKNDSFKKISFVDESGISSSDGGKPCAPPWAQSKKTMPCPALSNKSTNYSSSRTTNTKSQGMNDSNISEMPIASSTQYEPGYENTIQEIPSNRTNLYDSKIIETSTTSYESPSQTNASQSRRRLAFSKPNREEAQISSTRYDTGVNDSFSKREDFDEQPLANSTFRNNATEISTTPGTESNKSITKNASSFATVDDLLRNINEENDQLDIKKEQEDKSYYDYHASACHSSISGNYDMFLKQDPVKPNIFGYDFQTSTSSDLSDDDSKY